MNKNYVCNLLCAAFVPTKVKCAVSLGKKEFIYKYNSKQNSNMGIRHVCLHTKHAVNVQTLYRDNSRNRKVCKVTM